MPRRRWSTCVGMAILALAACEPGPWDDGRGARSAPRPAPMQAARTAARPRASRGAGRGPVLARALTMRSEDGAAPAREPAREAGESGPSWLRALERGVTSDGAPWVGGRDAKVVIEEFSDFGCPFCRRAAWVMHRLLKQYGRRIRLVFRQVPLTALHPDSKLAAQAALAALAQGKFWEMHDMLFANRDHSKQALLGYARQLGLDVARFERDMESERVRKQVERDMDEAARRGVRGTPTFFITGVGKVVGARPFEEFSRLIEQALATR